MSQIRFYTDEDLYAAVAVGLRNRGFDAVSTPEAGRLGETDESQLAWASKQQRALVTFNVRHFAALHCVWLQQNKHHAGIIVSTQRPLGELLRRLQRLAGTLDALMMCDRLEFLSDW